MAQDLRLRVAQTDRPESLLLREVVCSRSRVLHRLEVHVCLVLVLLVGCIVLLLLVRIVVVLLLLGLVLIVLLLGRFVVVLLLAGILIVLGLASILVVLLLLLRSLVVDGTALICLVHGLSIIHLIVVVRSFFVPALVSLDPDLVVLTVLVGLLWHDFDRTWQVTVDPVILLPSVLDL